jgi:hypothetical protein
MRGYRQDLATSLGRSYVQAHDPATDRWTMQAPLPRFRAGAAAGNLALHGAQRIVVVVSYEVRLGTLSYTANTLLDVCTTVF